MGKCKFVSRANGLQGTHCTNDSVINGVCKTCWERIPRVESSDRPMINVRPYHPDLYVEMINNFIVKQQDDGSIICLGRLDGNTSNKLSFAEKASAKALGLIIMDD